MPKDSVERRYDIARDRTGEQYQTRVGSGLEPELKIMRNPAVLTCEKCGGEEFYVVADQHPESSLIVLRCRQGKHYSRVFSLMVPQMDDYRARALGLWVPGHAPGHRKDMVPIDIEVDLGE